MHQTPASEVGGESAFADIGLTTIPEAVSLFFFFFQHIFHSVESTHVHDFGEYYNANLVTFSTFFSPIHDQFQNVLYR